jgi:hypothetical protein
VRSTFCAQNLSTDLFRLTQPFCFDVQAAAAEAKKAEKVCFRFFWLFRT